MNYIIRPYSPADREAVRHICCETGFSGKPVDPLFCDRDVFADFFTRYYTDWEPESSFVGEVDGQVVAYLTVCVRYHYHFWVNCYLLLGIIAPKVVWRLLRGRYNRQSRRFLYWSLFKGSRETPRAPKKAGHFHFNVLSEYRNMGIALRLFRSMEKKIEHDKRVKTIYCQIQTYETRRSPRLFQRFGLSLLDQREISKFRPFHDQKIYVSTFVKEYA